MSTIIPESESLKKAVRWISEHLKENPDSGILSIVQQAAMRFNLTPKDSLFLENFYTNNNQDTIH